MISIREAHAEDLPRVHALNQAARPAVSDMSLDDTGRYFRMAVYFRVAVEDDTFAGFLIGLDPGVDYSSPNYTWFSARYEAFVYVDRIVIAEGFRGRGVGQALYADIERFGRERGAPRVACEVNTRPRNDVSLRFHAKAGFREVGAQDTEGGRKTVVMLVKELAPVAPPGRRA